MKSAPVRPYSVGIDIINIHRVERLLKKSLHPSVEKCLSLTEQEKSPRNFKKLAMYWAKIWAAKEAFLKANHLAMGPDVLPEWTVLFQQGNQFTVASSKPGQKLKFPSIVSGSFFEAGDLVGAQVICS